MNCSCLALHVRPRSTSMSTSTWRAGASLGCVAIDHRDTARAAWALAVVGFHHPQSCVRLAIEVRAADLTGNLPGPEMHGVRGATAPLQLHPDPHQVAGGTRLPLDGAVLPEVGGHQRPV